MYPVTHFLFAFLLMQIFVKSSLISQKVAILFAVISVLIDLDHFIYYGIKHKNWSLKNSWNVAVIKHEAGERTFIHHSTGMIIVLFICVILACFNLLLSNLIFITYFSHILLDYIHINFKKAINLKKRGFRIRMPLYEIIVDIILLCLGIMFVFINN